MEGITVVLAGYFWQKLPVIERENKVDEIQACLKSSFIWSTSTGNKHASDPYGQMFAENLLQLGNGAMTSHKTGWRYSDENHWKDCEKTRRVEIIGVSKCDKVLQRLFIAVQKSNSCIKKRRCQYKQ